MSAMERSSLNLSIEVGFLCRPAAKATGSRPRISRCPLQSFHVYDMLRAFQAFLAYRMLGVLGPVAPFHTLQRFRMFAILPMNISGIGYMSPRNPRARATRASVPARGRAASASARVLGPRASGSHRGNLKKILFRSNGKYDTTCWLTLAGSEDAS